MTKKMELTEEGLRYRVDQILLLKKGLGEDANLNLVYKFFEEDYGASGLTRIKREVARREVKNVPT